MFNIVLLEPEIPANTGNIGRTCVASGLRLHLIEPLGFIINDKNLKRAGMDYWKDLEWYLYDDYEDFLAKNPDSIGRTDYARTKAHKTYADAEFKPGDYIMFGKESAGIPEEILVENEDKCIRIPMREEYRSLNLSNSVAIIAYEAMRQNQFKSLEEYGELHRLKWDK